MPRRELRLDVTDAADVGERAEIAASLFLPEGDWTELLIAIHGGGYNRKYWHPPLKGHAGYSYADHVVSTGKALLTLDMLGMGESSKPEPESKLSRMKIAAACDAAVRQVVAELGSGFSTTGIGHSMGGLMGISMQGAFQTFDRLAVLGWANTPMQLGGTTPEEMLANTPTSGYLLSPREAMRALFYLPDVPLDLIEQDEALGGPSPASLGRDALTPGIVHDAAARIACPVFIHHAVVDTSPDPQAEAAFFTASPSVAVFVHQGSAHCHNFATTRADGWRALDDWINATP
jgi:alpha-beta hydrolase superfamily lysophospholipase